MCQALIVTNKAVITQLGKYLSEVPKVCSSALAWYRAFRTIPNLPRAYCHNSIGFFKIVVEIFTWTLVL